MLGELTMLPQTPSRLGKGTSISRCLRCLGCRSPRKHWTNPALAVL